MTDCSTRRRFSPTPAWLICGLLVVECLLWLSERYTWFWFNERKGWTVLIGVAVVGVVLGLMLLWYLAALIFRLRFQFSIRSLLVLVVAVALPFSWVAIEMKQAREQNRAVAAVVQADGSVIYDFQIDQAGNPTKAKVPGPAWVRKILGNDFFTSVVRVTIVRYGTDAILEKVEKLPRLWDLSIGSSQSDWKITDTGLVHLQRMTQLRELDLNGSELTDAGLENLTGLHQLKVLCLFQSQVTEEGVKKLQQALPNCKIQR